MSDEVRAFWEEHYGQRPQVWSGRPNAVLVDEVADLPPGRALDLGCGEGGDAIWLASKGWAVTAVDVSQTALDRATAAAEASGVADRITWRRVDLGAELPAGPFDLVTAHFFQSPVELPRDRILRAAAYVVAPGGTVLVVDHAAAPPWASGHAHDRVFPTPEGTAADLGLDDGWDVVACETRERVATRDGQEGVLLDSVVRAARRG